MLKDFSEYFPNIIFDPIPHTYTVDGVNLMPVSNVIKNFYKEFDTETTSKNYALKYGFTQDEVKEAWSNGANISASHGTNVHDFAENYFLYRLGINPERPKVTCKQGLGVIQFFNSIPEHIQVVGLEVRVHSKEYGYCGTADILLYNTLTKKYIIADWKTNKELLGDQEFAQPLMHLNVNLNQDNLGKYSVQFSLYQIPLEDAGLEVESRILIWLQEDKPNKRLFKTYVTLDVTKELRKYLTENKL